MASVLVRALTWNLMHGRARPPAGRYLLDEFAAGLAGWEWQLALLQEVPPWWPQQLAVRLGRGVQYRLVLTSRNALLPARKAIAMRWPDAIKSNGGGANAILVRDPQLRIAEHRTLRLRLWPERRFLHAVRLMVADNELWAGNLHVSGRDRREAQRAQAAMSRWADHAPLLLGGDFNIRGLSLDGLTAAAHNDVDYVFASGLRPVGEREVLDRGRLSDHAPVAVTLALEGRAC